LVASAHAALTANVKTIALTVVRIGRRFGLRIFGAALWGDSPGIDLSKAGTVATGGLYLFASTLNIPLWQMLL